jgi:site-specific recombinase XerD
VKDWLAIRPAVEDPALFLNRYGHRLSVDGIQERLAHYCHQAGVWITCHQLRHTFGRHMVEAGMPVTSIQRLLGHRRLRTTQTYLYLSTAIPATCNFSPWSGSRGGPPSAFGGKGR